MNKQQVRVYELLADMIMKVVLAFFAGIAFLAVTIKLIFDPSWPMAAVGGIFTYTLGSVYKHYFPPTASARTTKKPSGKKP